MRTLVVLPTYEEAENIAEILRRLRTAVPTAEVLVVDDNSPDGTADVAKGVAETLGGIDVLVRPDKAGLGSAYRAGFTEGQADGYEVFVEMDSDLSHDPAALPDLLDAIERGAGLALGSRYVDGGSIPSWSRWRRALSKWGNRYAAAALGLPVCDATSGYRAYRASALAMVDLDRVHADGYGFQIEMVYRLARAGERIVEIPIRFSERERGHSKMSMPIVAEALVLVTWWGLRDRAYRLVGSRQPSAKGRR